MRILFLNHNLREQGTWFRVCDAARLMARRGHDCVLYTVSQKHWYRPTRDMWEGVELREGPSWNPWLHPDDGWNPIDIGWRGFRALVEKCDVVYAFAHPPNVYLPARIMSLLRRKPVFVDWCDLYQGGIFTMREADRQRHGARGFRPWLTRKAEAVEARLERRILKWSRGITVISSALEKQAIEWGVAPEKIMRLPSWANLETFRPFNKTECRKEFGLKADGIYFVYIANYNPDEKLLLDAFAKVLEQHPDVRLLARCPRFEINRPDREKLEARIHYFDRMPLDKIARLLGAGDANLLPMSDHPHNHFRWPHKFGDYLASGRPIISTHVGDTAAFFDNNDEEDRIGFAAEPKADAYAGTILEFLDEQDQWDRMGKNARSCAEKNLSGEQLMESLEGFIKSRLGKRP
ncbi:MAG: glycosyltransferase family 4 protein [Candidatus Sumerlaeia bacterium]